MRTPDWPTMLPDLRKALRIAEAAGTSTSFTVDQLRHVVAALELKREAPVEEGERLILEGYNRVVGLKLMERPFNRVLAEGEVTREFLEDADVVDPLLFQVAKLRDVIRKARA